MCRFTGMINWTVLVNRIALNANAYCMLVLITLLVVFNLIYLGNISIISESNVFLDDQTILLDVKLLLFFKCQFYGLLTVYHFSSHFCSVYPVFSARMWPFCFVLDTIENSAHMQIHLHHRSHREARIHILKYWQNNQSERVKPPHYNERYCRSRNWMHGSQGKQESLSRLQSKLQCVKESE